MVINSLILLLSILILSGCRQTPENAATAEDTTTLQQPWTSLFNHQNLKGWQILPGGTWKVQNGILIGSSPADEPLHGILLSKKEYGDFKLRVVFKILKGDSGLYFRAEETDSEVSVSGFQAEIDVDNETGGLYETGGRAWVVKPDPEKVKQWMAAGDWNELIVIAKGNNIRVFLNGHQTAALDNDTGRTKGHIGLQLHGGMEMHVMFQEVLILENPETLHL